MKIEINIPDSEIEYEVRRAVFRELNPAWLRDNINRIAQDKLHKIVEIDMEKNQFKHILKEAILEYLEKYQLREFLGKFKEAMK